MSRTALGLSVLGCCCYGFVIWHIEVDTTERVPRMLWGPLDRFATDAGWLLVLTGGCLSLPREFFEPVTVENFFGKSSKSIYRRNAIPFFVSCWGSMLFLLLLAARYGGD